MPYCFVPGCKSGYDRLDGKRFFTPPKKTDLFAKWASALSHKHRQLKLNSRVCDVHFSEDHIIKADCFIIAGKNFEIPRMKWRLKPGAVPNILPKCLSSPLKPQKHPRMQQKQGAAKTVNNSEDCGEAEAFTAGACEGLVNNSAVECGSYDKTGTKIEIKEEVLLSGVALKDVKDFSFKDLTVKSNSDDSTWDYIDEKDTKAKIKEETDLPDFASQEDGEGFFEDPLIKVSSCNEMDVTAKVKEELWCPEATLTEDPPAYEVITDGLDNDFQPSKSLGVCKEAVSSGKSGESELCSVEDVRRDMCFSLQKDNPECEKIQKCLTHEEVTKTKVNPNHRKAFTCDICEKSFTQLPHLKTHRLIHEEIMLYKCDVCNQEFNDVSSLKRHKLIHEGKKPHECATCKKSFVHLSDLKSHSLMHEGKLPFQCKVCEKTFHSIWYLKRHNLMHGGRKPHQCEICEKSFGQLGHLKLHRLIHEGKRPHKCEICGKSFVQMAHLTAHTRIHEGIKPYKCKLCEKDFSVLASLKRHHFVHEAKKQYKCEICQKGFAQLAHLKMHNFIHKGKKPYKCEICEKDFAQFSHLKVHYLSHMGKKPYECEICEQGFTRLSHLKSHNLVHESKNTIQAP